MFIDNAFGAVKASDKNVYNYLLPQVKKELAVKGITCPVKTTEIISVKKPNFKYEVGEDLPVEFSPIICPENK
jgi:hypothetical protein